MYFICPYGKDYSWCEKSNIDCVQRDECETEDQDVRTYKRQDLPRLTGRAYRREARKQKDIRLRKIITGRYVPHVGYIDYDFVDGEWTEVGTHIKHTRNSNRQRWIKRYTSKLARKVDISSGNSYRRLFDYWWTMY